MPPKNRNALIRTASQICQKQLKELVDAELEVIPGETELEWEPIFRRHVFRQVFNVWRDFDTVSTTVTPDGKITEMKIQGRFAGREELEGVKWLTPDEVIEVARTTNLIGDTAMVEELTQDADGMLSAKVIQIEHALPRAIQFTINPKTRQVAAYQVIPTGLRHG